MDTGLTSSLAAKAYGNSAAIVAGKPLPGPDATAGSKLTPDQQIKIRAAAEDFEAQFVTSMLESMWAGVKTDKMFGGGPGEEMYRSLLNQEYGKAIAKQGSLGIADSIQKEMLRLQEHH